MLQALLIFVLQIIYVPILTIRTILLVKNQTRSAAGVGLLEGDLHCQFRYCVSRFIKLDEHRCLCHWL